MSAIHRAPADTKQGNDFFINIAAITIGTDTFNVDGTVTAGTIGSLTGAQAASSLLVKDMGKTVTVSGATYRKVQAVSSAADDTTFYIRLVPATGATCEWARMTLQA